MKRWLLPLGSLTAVAAAAVLGLALAGVFDSDDAAGGDGNQESADDALGMCEEGTPDCDDLIVGDGPDDVDANPDPAGACLEGSEKCDDTADAPPPNLGDLDPDQPVDSGGGTDVEICEAAGNPECERRAMEAALNHLADTLDIDASEISISDSNYTEWSNACLGAAGPNEACAEVITPGFVIILEAGGDQYEYHTDTNGNVRLAE